MDRLETNDVLQYLLDQGVAERYPVNTGRVTIVPPVEAVDVAEEERIIWQVRPAHLFT